MLSHLGLPVQMGRALSAIWGQQQRWLRWSRWTTSGPERVCSSVPQGDAFSSCAWPCWRAWFRPLVRSPESARRCSRRSLLTTVPSRHVGCLRFFRPLLRGGPGPVALVLLRTFASCSSLLALRLRLRMSSGLVGELTSCKLSGSLGWTLLAPARRPTDRACTKVAGGSAHCEADRRVECLGRRPAFFHVLCTPKASWGWILRSPSQRMIRPMRAAYKALASAHQMGSSPLQRLLEGHRCDPSVAGGLQACSSYGRSWRTRIFVTGSGSSVAPSLGSMPWQDVLDASGFSQSLGAALACDS